MSDMSDAPSLESPNKDDVATDHMASSSYGGNFRLLADVPVRLSVEVGSVSKRLLEIIAFQEGEVVELDRQSDELLDIMVNGTLVAKGEVVTVDGRFGVRVAELVNKGAEFPVMERRGS